MMPTACKQVFLSNVIRLCSGDDDAHLAIGAPGQARHLPGVALQVRRVWWWWWWGGGAYMHGRFTSRRGPWPGCSRLQHCISTFATDLPLTR